MVFKYLLFSLDHTTEEFEELLGSTEASLRKHSPSPNFSEYGWRTSGREKGDFPSVSEQVGLSDNGPHTFSTPQADGGLSSYSVNQTLWQLQSVYNDSSKGEQGWGLSHQTGVHRAHANIICKNRKYFYKPPTCRWICSSLGGEWLVKYHAEQRKYHKAPWPQSRALWQLEKQQTVV